MIRPQTHNSLPLADYFTGTEIDPTLAASMRRLIRERAQSPADEGMLVEAILGGAA